MRKANIEIQRRRMTDLRRAIVVPLGQRREVQLAHVAAKLDRAKAQQPGQGEYRTVGRGG